jgi:hypothetical protein
LVRSSTGRDAASGTAGVRSSVGGGDGRCEGCSAFRYELFSPYAISSSALRICELSGLRRRGGFPARAPVRL